MKMLTIICLFNQQSMLKKNNNMIIINDIPTLDTAVNRYKTQIIITSSFLQEFEQISGNRRIHVCPTSTPEELVTTLQNYISGGKVAIHIQITDYDVNIIQQILIREIPATKFLKCTYFAQDIQTEEEAFRVVSI